MRGRTDFGEGVPRFSRSDWWGVVLEAPDARRLAAFYAEFLGWQIHKNEPDYATIAPDDGVAYLGFQTSSGFHRPQWPAQDDAPRITMHLDFEVDDLDAALDHALTLGARLADHQPQENVRVVLDPAGHPFCLYTSGGNNED